MHGWVGGVRVHACKCGCVSCVVSTTDEVHTNQIDRTRLFTCIYVCVHVCMHFLRGGGGQ